FASSHLRALASAFQKSGSCKCSDRARNCSPLYPSLCSRSFTFHQRYRYPPFSAASLIACWTLFMGQSYKCQLLWDRRSAGNGTSGHCQVSSRAGTSPELRLPNPVAQTRNSLCRRFRLDSRKSVRPFKGIICDAVSEFESCMPSQAVRSLWAMSRLQKYAGPRSRAHPNCGGLSRGGSLRSVRGDAAMQNKSAGVNPRTFNSMSVPGLSDEEFVPQLAKGRPLAEQFGINPDAQKSIKRLF